MSTLERLKELEAKATPGRWDVECMPEFANYSDLQFIVEMRNALPKLLAVVEAGDELAFQYEGLLEWISDKDCECCHCDDHDKLIAVLSAYRKAKDENSATE